MLEGFANASRIPELRRRLLFTAAMLAVYRIGVAVPTPGIDGQALADLLSHLSGTLFGFINLFYGGGLERFSVFALGIMPYISVAIILDLMKIGWPYLDELYKEGEAGRRKISQYTRYGTVGLAIVQGTMIALGLENYGAQGGGGSATSLIIMAGIVARLPSALASTAQFVKNGEMSIFVLILIVALAVVVTGGIVYVETGQRRIPIQYARRVVGRRVYGGQSSHLPLKF